MHRFVRNGSVIAAGALAAAAAGLLLRSVVAFRFGATTETDALMAALLAADVFTIPAVWILTTTFVPTFTRLAAHDRNDASTVARTVVVLATVTLVLLALGAVALAGPLARGMVGRGNPDLVSHTASLLPLLATAGVLVCIGGLATSLLQIHENFWLPALLLPARSVAAIAATLILGPAAGARAVVYGVVAGYFLQTLCLCVAAARHLPLRGPIAPAHPALRGMIRLMLPMIAGTLTFQINNLISVRFASGLDAGSITQFNYASALAIMLSGLIGGSLTDASFPNVSRSATLNDGGREFRVHVALLLRTVMMVAAAAAAALTVSAHEVASLLFGHGPFAGAAVEGTARVLRLLAIGLVVLPGPTVLSRVFYAMGNTRVPQLLVVPAVALHLMLNWLLVPHFGIAALAVTTTASHACLSVLLVMVLCVRYRVLDRDALADAAGVAVTTGVAVFVAMLAVRYAVGAAGDTSLTWQAARLLMVVSSGGLAFLLTTCTPATAALKRYITA